MIGLLAQRVSVRPKVLQEGWRGRVVPWSNQSTCRALVAFLEPQTVSWPRSYREKDFAFGLGHARVRPDRLNDPCPAHRPVACESGSASSGAAACMVEGLGRPTRTRLD